MPFYREHELPILINRSGSGNEETHTLTVAPRIHLLKSAPLREDSEMTDWPKTTSKLIPLYHVAEQPGNLHSTVLHSIFPFPIKTYVNTRQLFLSVRCLQFAALEGVLPATESPKYTRASSHSGVGTMTNQVVSQGIKQIFSRILDRRLM